MRLRVLDKQVGQAPDQVPALRGSHLAPRTLLKGLPGGHHRPVHVLARSLSHPRPCLPRVGVYALKSFTGAGLDPLSVDQEVCSKVVDSRFQKARGVGTWPSYERGNA